MNDADVSKQIQQMVCFIRQEAEEKANEISVSAEEEFNIEKLQLVEAEKKKIRQEYERKDKQVQVRKKIEYSMQLNASRLKVLQAQDDLVNSMKESASKELLNIGGDQQNYEKLLKDLIVQGLLRLKEPSVLLRCRESDLQYVGPILDTAKEEYANKANVHSPEIVVDQVYLPPAPTHHNAHDRFCSGGVVLASRDGKIVFENSLDARLEVVFRKKLPEEFNIEKLQLVEAEKKKIRQEYERKDKQVQVRKKIEYSMQLNASRLKVLQAQDDLVNSMKESASKELLNIGGDQQNYEKLLKDLIVQGLLRLKEPSVLLRCRESDLQYVGPILDTAKEEYANKANVHSPEIVVDQVYLPPAPTHHNAHDRFCSGGVVLASRDGKIVFENSLDARLEVVFRKKLPEEFNIEKLQLVEAEKKKIRQEYERKDKQVQVRKKIEYSMQLNASRLKVLQAQDDLVNSMKESASKELLNIGGDQQNYEKLLKDLIVQGLLRLKEPSVLLRCRESDLQYVGPILDTAKEEYANKANVHSPEIVVDQVYLPPAPTHHNAHDRFCSGGVVLASRDGKIVFENSLDARLEVVFRKKLPEEISLHRSECTKYLLIFIQ
ncbi:uncharacterized protein LOC121744408 isoform X1 [Salvia splendens]|uniref:uncharacterized protein LOC121744408 isoform X1 n=1 Tax=Salvia splendens TaxID=180675 RepID=UPI001C260A7F|nr:uncharacterized protein LOC121744408 isoform X1 [Salvia splendens]